MRSCLCIWTLLVSLSTIAAETELNEYGNSSQYDYSQTTETIVLNAEGKAQFYSPPFETEAPVLGVLLYAMILKYADNYEELVFPLNEPDYQIIILGPGQIRNIFVGDHWFLLEERVAFLNDEDYSETLALLQSRLEEQDEFTDERVVQSKIKENLSKPFNSIFNGVNSLKHAREKLQDGFKFVEERHKNFVPLQPEPDSQGQADPPFVDTEQAAKNQINPGPAGSQATVDPEEKAPPSPVAKTASSRTTAPFQPNRAPRNSEASAPVTENENAEIPRWVFFLVGFLIAALVIHFNQISKRKITR